MPVSHPVSPVDSPAQIAAAARGRFQFIAVIPQIREKPELAPMMGFKSGEVVTNVCQNESIPGPDSKRPKKDTGFCGLCYKPAGRGISRSSSHWRNTDETKASAEKAEPRRQGTGRSQVPETSG
jgi:hypothetical protein